MARWNQNNLTSWIDSHIIDYPTAINLNYNWSFGSAAGFCLGIQILSGAFLAMFYTGEKTLAFASIEYIMRDVEYGWLIRYLHANGASFFFITVYAHIFRGLYYGSFMNPRFKLWLSGGIMYVLMMGTAFIGYVLPWGQMSFWGVTVITSMLSIIPKYGKEIVVWVWGNYVVGDPTLHRFYSLHFMLPFILTGMVFVHLSLLHSDGSNNPLGIKTKTANINFYPYFYVKDLFGFFILLLCLSAFIFYSPNTLGHPDNYLEADPYGTPAHIVPEWYFLPYYAILRVVPHKAGGIMAMICAIVFIIFYPFFNTSSIRSGNFRPLYAVVYWCFVGNFVVLGWAGTTPVDEYYPFFGICSAIAYFCFFPIFRLVGSIEQHLVTRKI